MAREYWMPSTDAAVAAMLGQFTTNAAADSGALATKYSLSDAELARIAQAAAVTAWFLTNTETLRGRAQQFTQLRGQMDTGSGAAFAIPTIIQLPEPPSHLSAGVLTPSLLDPGFFPWFIGRVGELKKSSVYVVSDGEALGIEGTQVAPPSSSTKPLLTGDVSGSGEPILTCKKGVFQGFEVFLTRPGQAKKSVGFSTGRHFTVAEPLPAAGTAEVWTFEVQYRYQGDPFGLRSDPLPLTVRG